MADKSPVPIVLKWSKQTFQDQLEIVPGSPTSTFMHQVQSLTGVPVQRQKLLCKHGWKGILHLDGTFDENLSLPPPGKKHSVGATTTDNAAALHVTLIGSAEKLSGPPPKKDGQSLQDAEAAEDLRNAQGLDQAEGMIVAIQYPPQYRNDGKMYSEVYQYNRLVTGLPQLQIEDLLKQRRQNQTTDEKNDNKNGNSTSSNQLLGKVVMTMGLELRRAYVNDLAVLPSGTLVSAHGDGHVQLWEHGDMVRDVVHEGRQQEGGVDCLTALSKSSSCSATATVADETDKEIAAAAGDTLAFASGGRGCVRVWTDEGECVGALPCPPGTSPSKLISIPTKENDLVCLAVSFKITRVPNTNSFLLPPQNEAEQRRRNEAEVQEEVIRQTLDRISRCVQLWYSTSAGAPTLESVTLEPSNVETSAEVATLALLAEGETQNASWRVLVCGDVVGGLRLWKIGTHSSDGHQCEQINLLQLRPENTVVSILCIEALTSPLVAVSTERDRRYRRFSPLADSIALDILVTEAINIIDMESCAVTRVLHGHKDAVICMCSLPNGGLATGGGKMDATVKVWELGLQSQDDKQKETTPILLETSVTLDEVGYVFALAVLPDSKPRSKHYALAAARYNVVKICL